MLYRNLTMDGPHVSIDIVIVML